MTFGHDIQNAIQEPYRAQPPVSTTNHESAARPTQLAPSLTPASGSTPAPSAAVQPRHEAPASQLSNRSETAPNDTAGVHDVLRDIRQVPYHSSTHHLHTNSWNSPRALAQCCSARQALDISRLFPHLWQVLSTVQPESAGDPLYLRESFQQPLSSDRSGTPNTPASGDEAQYSRCHHILHAELF
jgi:hypothetical protein